MFRKFSAAILFILIALTVVSNVSADEYDSVVHRVFIADFNHGQFYGAMQSLDGDYYTSIALTLYDENVQTFEDMITPDQDGYITATFEIDDYGYNQIAHIYSEEYETTFTYAVRHIDESNLIDVYDVKPSTDNSFFYGTFNGIVYQMFGFVTEGSAHLLRNADPYSVNGSGWIVQSGNLIRIAATLSEENETPRYTISIPMIVK